METTVVFERMVAAYVEHSPRIIDSAGGTRSGKTFAALQLLIVLAMTDTRPTLASVVSETMPHLRRGAIRDFRRTMGTDWNESAWRKQDSIYTFPTGSQIEFFSADNAGKVHGPARDRLFINEAVNIAYETARQLFVRTSGLIILDYNPTHTFWVHEHVQGRDDCVSIHSTYRDNSFLSAAQVGEIERGRTDTAWWRVYGEGLVGQQEGLIYSFEQVDAMPDAAGLMEVYGLDFGFTNDPTALVHCLCDTRRGVLYVDELVYMQGLLNRDIAARLERHGISRSAPVYADSSEPKTIAELAGYGYNIRPCYKGVRKAEQVQAMKGWQWRVTKRSTNIIRELRGYVWQTDKDGRRLNEPTPFNDHAMDAIRYAVFTLFHAAGTGNYTVSVR